MSKTLPQEIDQAVRGFVLKPIQVVLCAVLLLFLHVDAFAAAVELPKSITIHLRGHKRRDGRPVAPDRNPHGPPQRRPARDPRRPVITGKLKKG